MEPNYYEILGLAPTAGAEEIRRAYRDLVADAMNDQPRFEALSLAFETLKDPARRATYDAKQGGAIALREKTRMPEAPPAPATSPYNLPVICPAGLSPCPLNDGQIVPDENFCPECGVLLGTIGTAPLLKESLLPSLFDSNGREWPLKAGENSVGRDGADVMLPDKSVSRRHAQFQVTEGTNAVTLTDLGSTNGTRHGASPLTAGETTALKDGDELRFGAVRLTIRIPDAPVKAITGAALSGAKPAALPAKPPAALPSFSGALAPVPRTATVSSEATGTRLVGKDGNPLTYVLGATEETTVGRRPENALMITTDSYISGKHAVILFENGRYKVMDVGSTNGTRWNGRRLLPQVPQTLGDGDEVIFGQTAFTFVKG